MCWNKEVSFLTLIIGTIFNLLLWFSYPQPYVRITICMWQFVLFMQLFEGISWISKDKKDQQLSDFSTKGAFIFNVLQPIIVALLCISISESATTKYVLIALIMIYLILLLHSVSSTSFKESLFEDEKCNHLRLYWWKHFSTWVFIFYMALLIVSFLSFTPLHFGIFQICYIIITLILSTLLYPCTYGSIWCWFAAFSPILIYIYLKLGPESFIHNSF